MRTAFSMEKLADADMAQSERILRACVHCGFCNATCPTYLLTGDENEGPRGRIHLMREMLQSDAPPDARAVAHIDACLSCLGCATTCPSGVDYMRLVDHARAHIETNYRRPLFERMFRGLLAFVLPHSTRFGAALWLGRWAAPFAALLPGRLARMAAMARALPPARQQAAAGIVAGRGEQKPLRVALLAGCVQTVLAPEINAAATRLLTRLGVEVATPRSAGCCGALSHHLGQADAAKQFARANIRAWMAAPFDAILVTASGCGSQVKDYGHLLRDDAAYAGDAAHISAATRDISEFLSALEMPPPQAALRLRIAYHAACSLQHGQRVSGKAESLLRQAGFEVLIPHDAHLCCGAAGSYTLLQPEKSEALAARKVQNLGALNPDMIASGNIGCQVQLASNVKVPVVHWVQLLDWALGGNAPDELPVKRLA